MPSPFASGTKSSASRSTAFAHLMDGIAQHWKAAVRPHRLDSAMTNAPRGVHPSIGAEGPLISAPRPISPYCAAGASSAVPWFLIIDPVSALCPGTWIARLDPDSGQESDLTSRHPSPIMEIGRGQGNQDVGHGLLEAASTPPRLSSSDARCLRCNRALSTAEFLPHRTWLSPCAHRGPSRHAGFRIQGGGGPLVRSCERFSRQRITQHCWRCRG